MFQLLITVLSHGRMWILILRVDFRNCWFLCSFLSLFFSSLVDFHFFRSLHITKYEGSPRLPRDWFISEKRGFGACRISELTLPHAPRCEITHSKQFYYCTFLLSTVEMTMDYRTRMYHRAANKCIIDCIVVLFSL